MVLADGKTFREKFGPRGVIHSWAVPDDTQKIEDTGPLTKKRWRQSTMKLWIGPSNSSGSRKPPGTFHVWMEPFVPLRVPLIFNLRRDPYERATITSNTYFD